MFRRAVISTLLFCSGVNLLILPAFATPKSGVLPDGRAFRVDSNGNQVVDYIAELENQVEVLTKQVYTLEDQVNARGCPEVKAAPVAACPACEQHACPETSYTKEVVKNVPDQNCLAELKALKLAASNQKVDFDVEISKLKNQLNSEQSSLVSASQSCSKENEQLKLELASQHNNTSEASKQLTELSQQRDELAKQLENVKSQFEQTRKELDSANLRVASLEVPQNASANLAALPIVQTRDSDEGAAHNTPQGNGVSTLSGARLRAIDSLKGALSSDINRTQSLLSTRDKVYAQNRGHSSGVTLEPAAAVSSSGRSLAQLRSALAAASTGRELSEIKSEVLEIQRKINDDLSAANRMKRLS